MAEWQHHITQTNGINLSFYRTSAGKKPLILLHGVTDNAMAWRRVALQLQNNYDVIMVDARGHGESDKPESGYGSNDHVADVAGLITKLELNKPIVMGHSMGGATATQLAAEHPDLVGALILEDPPWRDGELFTPQRTEEWKKSLTEQKQLSRADLVKQAQQDMPWDIIDIEDWADAKYAVSINVLNGGERLSWREALPKIQCPTLLIRADPKNFAIVSPEIAQEAQKLNANLQTVYISGAGHCIRRDKFDVFMAVVTQFLYRL